MIFSQRVIPEPKLEFGGGRHDIDPRRGLVENGPLQAIPGERVRIGVIGTPETVEGFAQFLERSRTGIEGKDSRLTNLYPPFPGIGNQIRFVARSTSRLTRDG